MGASADAVGISLAGDLSITSANKRLHVTGVATSTLPVKVKELWVTLRDGDSQLIGVESHFCRTADGMRHQLAFEQRVDDEVLPAIRSVELALDYEVQTTKELATALVGSPGRHGRVPLDVTMQLVPQVHLVSLAAFVDELDERTLIVLAEIELARGIQMPRVKVLARARDGRRVLGEKHETTTDPGRRVLELEIKCTDGMPTKLELEVTIEGSGFVRLGRVDVGGL